MYASEMLETLASLAKFEMSLVNQKIYIFLSRLQFGYFRAYCKYKIINKRACQQITIDFKTIPSECERHQMSFSMVGET
jgi:hypothetical protein